MRKRKVVPDMRLTGGFACRTTFHADSYAWGYFHSRINPKLTSLCENSSFENVGRAIGPQPPTRRLSLVYEKPAGGRLRADGPPHNDKSTTWILLWRGAMPRERLFPLLDSAVFIGYRSFLSAGPEPERVSTATLPPRRSIAYWRCRFFRPGSLRPARRWAACLGRPVAWR